MILTLLAGLTAWWSSFYGNHQLASVTIRYLHLTALILGGGTALLADRQVLGALRAGKPEREWALLHLHRAHVQVIACLLVMGASGVLMTAADAPTFLSSTVYWVKMSLVGLLAGNGIILLAAEKRIRSVGINAGWNRLVMVSTASATLWLTILFLGTLLTVAA